MLKEIIEQYQDDELLIAEGFEDAIIGVVEDFNAPIRIAYSVKKCLNILEKDMNEFDAMEFFIYNVIGGYVGIKTPIWVWDNFN